MSTCLSCAHLAEGEARTVCGRCEARIRRWLREADAQRPLLAASLHLGTAPAAGRTGGTGRAHSPLPVRGDVLNLLAAGAPGTVPDPHGDQSGPMPLDAMLSGWAHAVAKDRGARPHRRTGVTWSAWLLAAMPYVVTASWAGTFYTELDDMISLVRAITATEPRRRHHTAPCPTCHTFALGRLDWDAYVDCEACGLLLTPQEYEAHRARVMPPLVRLGILMTAAQHTQEQEGAAA